MTKLPEKFATYLQEHNLDSLTLDDIAHIWSLRSDFYVTKANSYYSINSVTVKRLCKYLNIQLECPIAPFIMLQIEGDTIWCGLKKLSNHGGRKITVLCQ